MKNISLLCLSYNSTWLGITPLLFTPALGTECRKETPGLSLPVDQISFPSVLTTDEDSSIFTKCQIGQFCLNFDCVIILRVETRRLPRS